MGHTYIHGSCVCCCLPVKLWTFDVHVGFHGNLQCDFCVGAAFWRMDDSDVKVVSFTALFVSSVI